MSLSKKSNNSLELSLIQNIALRRSIPGSSYGFLIPQYHYWLEQEDSTCLNDLTHWYDLFKMHRLTIQLILKVMRNKTSIKDHVALDGFFKAV